MADYVVLVRDAKTLALLGEIPTYQHMAWTRRAVEQGEFQLDLARHSVDADLIRQHRLIEVRRDSVFEFAGIIEHARYDAIDETWQVKGPDLLWLLAGRTVKPASGQEFDAVAGVAAETAMKGYVSRHLLGAGRDINAELGGVTFDVEPDAGRGASVTFNARFTNLLTGTLYEVARSGNLLHAVEFQPEYAGYHYLVREPVDATWTSGTTPVIFSTQWLTVSALQYETNGMATVNAVYVLGAGQGAARTVREVTSSDSITAGWRRETSADSRNNDTTAAMDQDGQALIAQALAAATRITAQPLPIGTARYRAEWDLGDDVTVAIPEIGIEVDRRIVEVKVTLDDRGEDVRISLGASAPTLGRVIADALRRSNRVQVA